MSGRNRRPTDNLKWERLEWDFPNLFDFDNSR